jgi:hypothetical protein
LNARLTTFLYTKFVIANSKELKSDTVSHKACLVTDDDNDANDDDIGGTSATCQTA